MIVILKPTATHDDAQHLLQRIESAGLRPLHLPGTERVVLGAIGDERKLAALALDGHPMVEEVKPILAPYKLVSRELHDVDSVVEVGSGQGKTSFGGGAFAIIAGPCAVESRAQMTTTAHAVVDAGAHMLRGGAFKPRTSPYSFQGLGHEGLEVLSHVSREVGRPVVTEVIDANDVDAMAEHVHMLQVGARNMQNFRLLQAVGQSQLPVMLKRGMSSTLKELLLAAEYIVHAGNPNVVLCERGIRTFETSTRNTLDLSAVPYLKEQTHLPVIVDPSHGTGRRSLVAPMTLAAAAAGADGVVVEVHCDPTSAQSDGAQSLFPEQFSTLMTQVEAVVHACGRELACH
mgnify:CR=1 FL=1